MRIFYTVYNVNCDDFNKSKDNDDESLYRGLTSLKRCILQGLVK